MGSDRNQRKNNLNTNLHKASYHKYFSVNSVVLKHQYESLKLAIDEVHHLKAPIRMLIEIMNPLINITVMVKHHEVNVNFILQTIVHVLDWGIKIECLGGYWRTNACISETLRDISFGSIMIQKWWVCLRCSACPIWDITSKEKPCKIKYIFAPILSWVEKRIGKDEKLTITSLWKGNTGITTHKYGYTLINIYMNDAQGTGSITTQNEGIRKIINLSRHKVPRHFSNISA